MIDIAETPLNIDEMPIIMDTPESTGDTIDELTTPVIKKRNVDRLESTS